jgi:hypothetical protein
METSTASELNFPALEFLPKEILNLIFSLLPVKELAKVVFPSFYELNK